MGSDKFGWEKLARQKAAQRTLQANGKGRSKSGRTWPKDMLMPFGRFRGKKLSDIPQRRSSSTSKTHTSATHAAPTDARQRGVRTSGGGGRTDTATAGRSGKERCQTRCPENKQFNGVGDGTEARRRE